MYGTRLIVAGLSLVQFCGNWKSPWSTWSEVVKTAWHQVKMHEKLWAIRLPIQCYWSVLCNQQPSLLKSCQGSSCHVYIETNFNYDMPQYGIIQWLLWLNCSHIHAWLTWPLLVWSWATLWHTLPCGIQVQRVKVMDNLIRLLWKRGRLGTTCLAVHYTKTIGSFAPRCFWLFLLAMLQYILAWHW